MQPDDPSEYSSSQWQTIDRTINSRVYIIGNALSCRTVETASTVSTKYAILSEKHEWDSRQYPPRVNAHTHLLPGRDKSSGSWTSFTLCQTLLCQQFSVADFPSPPAFHFRPAGKVVERINLILQRKSSLLCQFR